VIGPAPLHMRVAYECRPCFSALAVLDCLCRLLVVYTPAPSPSYLGHSWFLRPKKMSSAAAA
jgi:hypothetical protein